MNGQRETDPRLTTRDCADKLGVTTGFIVGEIHAGRLRSACTLRRGARTVYRIAPVDFRAYLRQHWGWSSTRAS